MEELDSFAQVFDLVRSHCAEQMSLPAYTLWIKDIVPVKFEDSTVYLRVKTDFKKKIIENQYIPVLSEAFLYVMGFEVSISVECEEENPNFESPAAKTVKTSPEGEYSFDNFIVGSSNKFAHAASLAVAANPGHAYNPLFIHGPSGLGKTHLLCAICNEIKKDKPNLNIIFVNGEKFTNELIEAIKTNRTNSFHEKYRQADVLLMDDIQFIAGKDSTQEEFFHTFNTLYHDNKQIILTSDRPPKEIKTLETRLTSRFEWGLLADVQPPDFETRTLIIRRKAEHLNLDIPVDVSEYMANKLKNNIRQLEGAVKKLNAYRLLENEPPSIMSAQNAIRDILNDNQPVPVTIGRIIEEVGRTYGISPDDIRSDKRSANISNSRKVAIYVIREITQISMSLIGEEFGGRHHSTIVYSVQEVEKNMKKDSHYRETVEDILKNIRSASS